MKVMRRSLEWLSVVCFLLFTTEIMLGGAGEMIMISGVGIRRFLFLLTVASFVLLGVARLAAKEYQFKIGNWKASLTGALIVAGWVVLIPLFYGQGIGLAIRDAGPLIGAALVVALFDDAVLLEFWKRIRGYLFFLLLLCALFHIFLYVDGVMDSETLWTKSNRLRNFWDPTWPTFGDKFVLIGAKPWGPRVNFASSFLMLISLYLSLFCLSGWNKFLRNALLLVCLVAIGVTQTRSLLIAAGVFLFVTYLFKRHKPIGIKNDFHLWLLIAAPFVLVFVFLPTIDLNSSFLHVFSRGETDNIRADQLRSLFQNIGMFPFLGTGFGAHAVYIRDPLAPFAYELAVIALIMKMGVGGLIALTYLLFSYVRAAAVKLEPRRMAVAAGPYALYCAIIAANFFNPSIFSFFGTFFIIFVCLETKYLLMLTYGDQN
ncbi:hypothetical protein DXT88_01735 [Herbaspirillum lusitanum]|uniref:O-antigen ligase family protein n=1 Tax=Herbaspirillum lusitanum TaxID=213312 RepID=UPI0022387850|nr:hypothetical protein [Herbaspirillum lusitanum]MCW5296890.1 hypothetical protein [Herbaspirillum lusitanum]